jgi:photosystem II stability/assembly factor-like uncharacterized protein
MKNKIVCTYVLLLFTLVVNAQWQQTYAPMGNVNSIFCDSNVVYVGTDGNGIYCSSGNDNKWILKNNGLSNLYVKAINRIGNNIYVGTMNGMYLSKNFGSSWVEINKGLQSNGLNFPEVNTIFSKDTVVYIGTNDGLYFSCNGKTWSSSNELPKSNVLSIISFGNEILASFYGSSVTNSIYSSNDNGKSWILKNNVNISVPIMCMGYIGNKVLAGTKLSGMFIKNENSDVWETIKGEVLYPNITTILTHNNIVYAGTSKGIYKSIDQGITWSKIGLDNSQINTIAIQNNRIYAGAGGNYIGSEGVYFSEINNFDWKSISNGISPNVVVKTMISKDKYIYAGTENSVFISENNGFNWYKSNNGYPANEVVEFNSLGIFGNYLYAGTNQGIYVSSNNGVLWKKSNVGLPKTSNAVNSISIKDNAVFIGTQFDGIFTSINKGSTWASKNIGLPSVLNVKCIESNKDGIYIGTSGSGIYFSNNNGNSWLEINNGFELKTTVNCISIDGSSLYIGTNQGKVFSSNDNGKQWTDISTGIPRTKIYTILIYEKKIIVGTWDGVFISKDEGKSWIQFNEGLKSKSVYSMIINSEYLYVGTNGTGLWRRNLSEL